MARELLIRIEGDDASAKAALQRTETGITDVGRAAQKLGTIPIAPNQQDVAKWQNFQKNFDLGERAKAGAEGMNQVRQRVEEANGAFLGLKQAAVGLGFKKAVSEAMDLASRVKDISSATGISIQDLQRLNVQAETSGTSLERVASGVLSLQKNLVGGNEKVTQAVRDLGLDVGELLKMDPAKMFATIAEKIAALPEPAQRTAAAFGLFKGPAEDLLPLLTTRVDLLRQNVVTMSDDTVRNLATAQNAWTTLKIQGVSAIGEIIGSLGSWDGALALLSTNPFLGEHVGHLKRNKEEWRKWKDDVVNLASGTVEFVRQIPGWFKSVFDSAVVQIQRLPQTFQKAKDTTIDIVRALYEGVKLYLVDKFTDIVNGAKSKIDAVTGFFADMYKKVVGGSIVPDMVRGIGKWFDRLDDVMLTPIRSATSAVVGLFEGMGSQVQGIVGRLVDGLSRQFVGGLTNLLKGGSFAGRFNLSSLLGLGGGAAAGMVPGLATSGINAGGGFAGGFGTGGTGAGFGQFATSAFGASLLGGGAGITVGMLLGEKYGKAAGIGGGAATGAAVGAFGGPVGMAVGAIAGAIAGAISGNKNTTKGQREDFAKELGFVNEKGGGDLGALYRQLSSMGPAGEDLRRIGEGVIGKKDTTANVKWMEDVVKLMQEAEQTAKDLATAFGKLSKEAEVFGGKAPAALQGMIQELLKSTKLTEEQRLLLQGLAGEPSWQSLQSRAQALGIELSALGPQFQQAKIGEIAMGYARDLLMFKDAGADVNGVLRGMQDEVQAVVIDALKFQTTLPEAFRSVLQPLVEMGLLVDENGNKLEDLSRFQFSGEFEDIFKDMKNVLMEIRDLLADSLPAAAERGAEGIRARFRDFEIRVPFKFDVENPDLRGAETQEFPSFQDRPLERVTKAGVAMLHPGDVVGVPSGRSVVVHNQVRLDLRGAYLRSKRETRRLAEELAAEMTLAIHNRYAP